MEAKTETECRCEKTTCGCARAAERCTCGERCECKGGCRCGGGCGCSAKK